MLVLGGISVFAGSGKAPLALAMWLAPMFLLRFAHLRPTPSGFVLMFLTISVAFAIGNRAMTPFQGAPYVAFVFLAALTQTLPYVADRLVSPRLWEWASTLVFPLAWVSIEFINTRISPAGSWYAMAYSQYGNLPLMQVASAGRDCRTSSWRAHDGKRSPAPG